MTSNSKQALKAQGTPAQNELSEHVLAKIVGGFNPQPDPPGDVAKLPTFGIRPSQFGILPPQFGIR